MLDTMRHRCVRGKRDLLKRHETSKPATGWLSSDVSVGKQLIAEAVNTVLTRIEACKRKLVHKKPVRE